LCGIFFSFFFFFSGAPRKTFSANPFLEGFFPGCPVSRGFAFDCSFSRLGPSFFVEMENSRSRLETARIPWPGKLNPTRPPFPPATQQLFSLPAGPSTQIPHAFPSPIQRLLPPSASLYLPTCAEAGSAPRQKALPWSAVLFDTIGCSAHSKLHAFVYGLFLGPTFSGDRLPCELFPHGVDFF